MTDADLMSAASRGDEAAFRILYDRHGPTVFRFAWLLTGSSAEAEDVTQECFLVLLRKTFDPGKAQLRTWLLGITRRLCLRANQRQRRVEVLDVDIASGGETVEVTLIRNEAADAVRQAMLGLPEGQREAVFLFEFESLSLAEVGAVLDIDANAVKARLYRGRQQLKQSLRGVRNPLGRA